MGDLRKRKGQAPSPSPAKAKAKDTPAFAADDAEEECAGTLERTTSEKDLSCTRQSWLEWLDDLFAEAPADEGWQPNTLELDLDLAGNDEIRAHMARLDAVLQRRREAAARAGAAAQTRARLAHVQEQLDLNETVPVSIPHLEIYRSFLARTQGLAAGGEGDGQAGGHDGETAATLQALAARVEAMLEAHPERSLPRSGDTEKTTETRCQITKVPAGRRRQTAATFMLNFFTGPMVVIFSLFLFLYTVPMLAAATFAAYYSHIYFTTSVRPRPWAGEGSGMSEGYRGSVLYKHFADYFPLRLAVEKRDEFSADGRYLFCLHPHGVQSAAVFSLLATSSCGVAKLLPGLTITAQTLPMNFWAPVMREHCIAMGVGNASKASIIKALTWRSGASTVLVVGGAKEALHASPHTNKIALKERMGFVRIALTTGASLVPCYAFGENSLYDNLTKDRPALLAWQRRVQKLLTYTPLFVAGRGVFSYSGGLIPHRRPVTTVVGKPLSFAKVEKPSMEEVAAAHKIYVAALQELFETYREIYDPKCEDMELI